MSLKCLSSQIILALLVTVGFFFCLFYMLHWGFPAENKDQLNGLMGVLTTIFTLIMNFYFGSSSGSAAKDAIMGSIVQSSTPSAPATVNVTNTEKTDGTTINLDTTSKT